MLTGKFRPWGELLWVIQRLEKAKWNFIGCVATEDRCTKAFDILTKSSFLNKTSFFEIKDPIVHNTHTEKQESNRNIFIALDATIQSRIIERELLLADSQLYSDIGNFLNEGVPDLIIDISCLPKRFFFPLVKLAILDDRIKNLIITYTRPEKYCIDDLSDEPEPWYPLPLFMPTKFPEETYEIAVVGTGFMPFSLPKLLKNKHSEIGLRLLFPFPPGPPNYQRSWEFLRKIENHYTLKEDDKIIRINSLDLSEAFDHICSTTNFGDYKVLFAPYGPKPISLAMCIYASLTESPVYYTQPKYYNPNYSEGSRECFAYCIKIEGKNLYNIKL
jgi:hypothetical protein